MAMKPAIKTETPSKEPSIGTTDNLPALREKLGVLSRVKVRLATSRAAADAVKHIEQQRVSAYVNIAITSIKLAEVAIRASLVGNAMPAIGALATRVNEATTAVDQSITNSAAAQVYSHMENRQQNLKLVEELLQEGKVSVDEGEVLKNFALADACEDIEGSRRRKAEAKAAVACLHSFALRGIAEAKDKILL